MESLEEIIDKVPPSPPGMDTMRFNPGDKIYSRNPKNDIIEEGWQVIGVDPKEGKVQLQQDGREDRTQSVQELTELNMLFAKGNPGEPSQAQTPQTPEEFDALSEKVEELL